MSAHQQEADKLELAARRFLAERGEAPVVPRDAITRAMDQGMTWPIGCLGMPDGYVVDSSSAESASDGASARSTRRTRAGKAGSTTAATGAGRSTAGSGEG